MTAVGGASTIQQCLRAGLADELHLMPVLLGGGLRLFDDLGPEPLADRTQAAVYAWREGVVRRS